MTDGRFSLSSDLVTENPNPLADLHDDQLSDNDTASQRSISLSSPPTSPKMEPEIFTPLPLSPASPEAFTRAFELDSDLHTPEDPPSAYTPDTATLEWNERPSQLSTTAVKSPYVGHAPLVYSPTPITVRGDTESVASFSTNSSASKKAQRESMLLYPLAGPLILGIGLVDFNHIVGPKIEFHEGEIFEDEEIAKILPFLALPDGAHLVIDSVVMNSWRSYLECSTQVLFHLVF